MAENPNDPRHQEIEQEEESRRRFEADVKLHQSNVLPLDAARNEGRFYGELVRGRGPLSGVQRVGFFIVGNLACCWAMFIVMGAFPQSFGFVGRDIEPPTGRSVSLLYLPFAVLAFFLGLKVIGTAITPRRRKQ